MNLLDLIEDMQVFDQPCKFANRCGNHSIYCHSEDKNAPRKCTYRMYPENMKECKFFKENKNESNHNATDI